MPEELIRMIAVAYVNDVNLTIGINKSCGYEYIHIISLKNTMFQQLIDYYAKPTVLYHFVSCIDSFIIDDRV